MWWTHDVAGGRDERDREQREVEHWSDVYEDALRRNDVDVLNELFWHDAATLRFGVADHQVGFAAIAAWRADAPAIPPQRVITTRHVVTLAPGVVAVDLMFDDGDPEVVGRQSQTWLRVDGAWRIARAHVSLIHR